MWCEETDDSGMGVRQPSKCLADSVRNAHPVDGTVTEMTPVNSPPDATSGESWMAFSGQRQRLQTPP